MQSDYLIIRGTMGVGKTSTLKELFKYLHSQDINCAALYSDVVRKFINRREPNFKNKLLGAKNIVSLANNLISEGYFPLIEGVFANQNILDILKNNILGSYKLIRLYSDHNINMQRNSSPEREWVIEEKNLLIANTFYEKNKKYNKEELLINSTNIDLYTVRDKILTYIL